MLATLTWDASVHGVITERLCEARPLCRVACAFVAPILICWIWSDVHE
jgi:hypothetical protein